MLNENIRDDAIKRFLLPSLKIALKAVFRKSYIMETVNRKLLIMYSVFSVLMALLNFENHDINSKTYTSYNHVAARKVDI